MEENGNGWEHVIVVCTWITCKVFKFESVQLWVRTGWDSGWGGKKSVYIELAKV